MKGAISFGIGILLFFFTIEIVQAVETRSIREEELRHSVTSAVYTALEMSITEKKFLEEMDYEGEEEAKINEELKSCFLNVLNVQVKSDSKIKVSILKVDYKKGILDVYTEADFLYGNGRTGYITYRKTGILNPY